MEGAGPGHVHVPGAAAVALGQSHRGEITDAPAILLKQFCPEMRA